MTFYSLDVELNIPHIRHVSDRGKQRSTSVHASSCLGMSVTHDSAGSWQAPVTAALPPKAVGTAAIHHTVLEGPRHLSEMKPLSFRSSERGLHSSSPKLLSPLGNPPHYLLRCLSPKQH